MLSAGSRGALIKAAIQAREYAYLPHSNFRVGAGLMCTDGTIIKGASIDNASYGALICAEQTAIVNAVSEGEREFSALAIVSDVITPISPCGICRQVIREFCGISATSTCPCCLCQETTLAGTITGKTSMEAG